MKNKINNKGGMSILGVLLLGFILVLVISYFNISIKTVVESPTGQENINYVKGTTKSVWDKYLKDPASYLWNEIWVKIFWATFVQNMEYIRDNKTTDIEKLAPQVNTQQ
ncbi:MAG: hypothetical protein WC662_00875 [Candidatus Paceibacterota bacterium]|jgi:hypothetical protein